MKLEVNNRKKTEKLTNVEKLNDTLMNNQRFKKKSQKNLETTFRLMKTKITIHQNLIDVAKAVLRAKFLSVKDYIKKE